MYFNGIFQFKHIEFIYITEVYYKALILKHDVNNSSLTYDITRRNLAAVENEQ